MWFSTPKDCLKFFNMSMIEHNHRDHMEHNVMRRHDVTVGDQPTVVITGLCGDIFIFTPVKKARTVRPIGWKLSIDGAVHDGAGPMPLTTRATELFNLAVSKGFTPVAFLACISEHRTCGLAPEEMDDFDQAYMEEMDHLQAMLELLV